MSPTTTSTITTSSLASRPPTASTLASSAITRSIPTTTSTAAGRSLRKRLPTSKRAASTGISSVSTPNLNALYSSHAHAQPRLAPPLPVVQPLLLRKASFAALTSSSLATIPDDTESYAFDSLNDSALGSPDSGMPPLTASRFGSSLGPGSTLPTGPDVGVGDSVDVPGGMTGTVRFVGSVAGRKGVFAGVELHPEFAARGKNNGDVDGVSYFSTSSPGAGIFLPLSKAVRRESSGSLPLTPTSGSGSSGLKLGSQNSVNFTPLTPSLPKFSQSVNGHSRASSPQGKRSFPRTSLQRPESPVRRLQTTPVPPRPSLSTPGPRASSRFGSPTNKFSQSMHTSTAPTIGDPSKRGPSLRPERPGSVGPRSISAMGGLTTQGYDDDLSSLTHLRPNAGAALLYGQRNRPASRAMSHHGKTGSSGASAADEEVERLRAELEDRERQLKDQANTLADMESSLTELQTLMESPDGPMGTGMGMGMGNRRDSIDDKDSAQLRALLREKNDKIAMLTAEFDTHRADFRSTIDTLEMASTETERVYEKKIEELMQEIHELESRTSDVHTVAEQLKQLEELVQELEEGLEDARRGEAEARGELEFLRGEVERTRAELQRERDKNKSNGANGVNGANGWANGASPADLARKDDEIRGLKAIIHSLSQAKDSSNDREAAGSPEEHRRGESINDRMAREKLERDVADLQVKLNFKTAREAEMERELEQLRKAAAGGSKTGPSSPVNTARPNRNSTFSNGSRSSLRDSRGTVVLSREFRESVSAITGRSTSTNGTRSPDLSRKVHHVRGSTLDTMPESDAYSSVTDSSTLWCEICEASGHDILTCTNMFGPQKQQQQAKAAVAAAPAALAVPAAPTTPSPLSVEIGQAGKDAQVPPLDTASSTNEASSVDGSSSIVGEANGMQPAEAKTPEPARATTPTAVHPEVKTLPDLMGSGPVAGKESGTVDTEKWCALCERDGHDSVDCPFEDAF